MATITTPDLKDPGLYEAGVPYDLFAELRRDDPVHWNPEQDGAGFWSVMRHADVVEVSRQPLLFSSAHENGGHRIFNENEVGLTGAGESAIGKRLQVGHIARTEHELGGIVDGAVMVGVVDEDAVLRTGPGRGY